MRWRGGAITQLDLAIPRFQPMGPRTDEDTRSLLRRLAALYPDEVIAGILNRQGRKTATGERFTANQVGNLRRYRKIPRFQPPAEPPQGELATIRKAAQILGLNTSTIRRWLADGFIAGEQVTPGAPWQIRITDELRARIVEQAPPDYLPMAQHPRARDFHRTPTTGLFDGDDRTSALVLSSANWTASTPTTNANFGAQSHGPHTRCLRFAGWITPPPRKTRFRRLANLTGRDWLPGGSQRKVSGHPSSFPRLRLTHPIYSIEVGHFRVSKSRQVLRDAAAEARNSPSGSG
jgi:hypothetical protein